MVARMAEVHPHVLAQMHRIHQAVNSGTVDKDTVNDALKQMHDHLSGAAHDNEPDQSTKGDKASGSHRKPHKKR